MVGNDKIPVCNFTLAVDERKKVDGQWTNVPLWIDCVAWDKLASLVKDYAGKGMVLAVSGSLTQEEWADKETGAKRTKLKLKADQVQLPAKGDSGSADKPERREPPVSGRREQSSLPDEDVPF